MKALLHVHSTYSYDGESSLEELCTWGEKRGLHAILLSEHTNDFDRDKMSRFVADCDALADRECRLVPGLEFPVRGGFHLLGFNVRSFEPIVDPLAVVCFIRDQGGLSVLAHPGRHDGSWPDDATLSVLDGLEVWNARYDGRFVPSNRVLIASESVIARHSHLARYCGQDLHATQSHRLLLVEGAANDSAELIAQLRMGAATMGAPAMRFGMRVATGAGPRLVAAAVHPLYRAALAVREGVRGASRPKT